MCDCMQNDTITGNHQNTTTSNLTSNFSTTENYNLMQNITVINSMEDNTTIEVDKNQTNPEEFCNRTFNIPSGGCQLVRFLM